MDFNPCNSLNIAWEWTTAQASAAAAIVRSGEILSHETISSIPVILKDKIQLVWKALKPSLGMASNFITSDLGIAMMLLGSTIICMQFARNNKDMLQSSLWMVVGVISAIVCGAFLVGVVAISSSAPFIAFKGL